MSEEKHRLTVRALQARAAHPAAFIGESAGYVPLPSSSGHAVVFARTEGELPVVITVATRVAMELEHLGGWGDHTVTLPDGEWHDTLTGTMFDGGQAVKHRAREGVVPLAVRKGHCVVTPPAEVLQFHGHPSGDRDDDGKLALGASKDHRVARRGGQGHVAGGLANESCG